MQNSNVDKNASTCAAEASRGIPRVSYPLCDTGVTPSTSLLRSCSGGCNALPGEFSPFARISASFGLSRRGSKASRGLTYQGSIEAQTLTFGEGPPPPPVSFESSRLLYDWSRRGGDLRLALSRTLSRWIRRCGCAASWILATMDRERALGEHAVTYNEGR
jgi:hypothetical protein